MKSEHRHELKTNELAQRLINFPQWAQKNLKLIIYISVIAILVAGSGFLHWYRKNVESVQKKVEFTNLITQLPQNRVQILQAQAEGLDISYRLIQLADNLQSLANTADNDQMAALALIKKAETLRSELNYRSGTVEKQDIITQINQAKTGYAEAINKASSNPSLTAAAKFGLGLCEEELGNFDIAKQIYGDIVADTELEKTTAAAQAKLRLATMADYEQKVVFQASPQPAPAATEALPTPTPQSDDIILPSE